MTLPRRRAPAVVPASPKPFSALGSVASAVSSAIVSAGGRTAAPHEAALLGSPPSHAVALHAAASPAGALSVRALSAASMPRASSRAEKGR